VRSRTVSLPRVDRPSGAKSGSIIIAGLAARDLAGPLPLRVASTGSPPRAAGRIRWRKMMKHVPLIWEQAAATRREGTPSAS
jgi:hypothetical protein